MNWPAMVLGFTALVGATMSCVAGERDRWIPGPSSLHFGAIDDGYLLSYQWEPSDAPHPPSREPPSLAGRRVPAERWLAAIIWEPVDIQWQLCDLDDGRVTPLKEVMPYEANALSHYRNGAAPHHAPHRWRWADGHLWLAKFNHSVAFGVLAWLQRMPFDPRHPATSHAGSPTWPPGWSNEAYEALQKDIQAKEPLPPGPWADRVAAYKSDSGVLRGRFRMRVIEELVFHGMPWWDDWAPADGYRQNRMDYDCVPLSDHEAVVAALAENGMSVWKGDRRRAIDWGQPRPPRDATHSSIGPWRRVATFASPFIEPFHLTLGDDGYFFVTDESGEVHRAQEQEGEWTTREIWNDPARPIVAMLTNSNNSTTYVFGKDFYFQLARQIEVKPCKDITQGCTDLADPMRTVLECAQVLQAADLLGSNGLFPLLRSSWE